MMSKYEWLNNLLAREKWRVVCSAREVITIPFVHISTQIIYLWHVSKPLGTDRIRSHFIHKHLLGLSFDFIDKRLIVSNQKAQEKLQ